MNDTELQPSVEGAAALLHAYLQDRVVPHPLLQPYLARAALSVTGSVAFGAWDEHSDFDLQILLSDEDHSRLGRALRDAGLWDPARDFRLRLEDREPFRRFPGVEIRILSRSELAQEFRFRLPVALWNSTHAVTVQDPLGELGAATRAAERRFAESLDDLRCEHYYRFRQARNDLAPRVIPRRMATVLAIKRGEAVREALRLAFLADGKPYPYDKWLEVMAERETRSGENIVTAVRALLAAEPDTVEHTSKVLRDRVIFALQQGGVRDRWLEQWWLWPSVAPSPE